MTDDKSKSSDEYDFEEAARLAKARKEKAEKERNQLNKNVLRSYQIKK